MLAISSDRYKVPRRAVDNEHQVQWMIEPINGSRNGVLIAYQFTYTFVEGPFKASFTYDRTSVKPSPRTLRVYGADALKDFVSRLSVNSSKTEKPFGIFQIAEKSNNIVKNQYDDWALTNPHLAAEYNPDYWDEDEDDL